MDHKVKQFLAKKGLTYPNVRFWINPKAPPWLGQLVLTALALAEASNDEAIAPSDTKKPDWPD
jgi:hypothetical protein